MFILEIHCDRKNRRLRARRKTDNQMDCHSHRNSRTYSIGTVKICTMLMLKRIFHSPNRHKSGSSWRWLNTTTNTITTNTITTTNNNNTTTTTVNNNNNNNNNYNNNNNNNNNKLICVILCSRYLNSRIRWLNVLGAG